MREAAKAVEARARADAERALSQALREEQAESTREAARALVRSQAEHLLASAEAAKAEAHSIAAFNGAAMKDLTAMIRASVARTQVPAADSARAAAAGPAIAQRSQR